VAKVNFRKDIFLGYSSEAEGTARNIARLLSSYDATVLDWQDFGPGTILEQIEAAASRCSAGVFLFTNSDKLEGQEDKAAPRDNVVFEAGYFAHAKGQQRVLIVREFGAKMPADLGGAIYAPLADRSNVDPLAKQLQSFVKALYA
jgi:predicted nucleotide-binding protein